MAQISLQLPDRENDHLEAFCKVTTRTKTEVIRELIRSLLIKGALNPLD
jgi:predicted DNA-binding protein